MLKIKRSILKLSIIFEIHATNCDVILIEYSNYAGFKWLNMLKVKRSGEKKALKGNGEAFESDEKL